jgi:hypothetical protein
MMSSNFLFSLLTTLQEATNAGQVLISLSPLISQSLVPIEDWINTVSFLIARCSQESPKGDKMHSTIHSICMACTSPSHVRSLVNEGILDYWDGVLGWKSGVQVDVARVTVLEAISHLTAIDKALGSRIDEYRVLICQMRE